MYRLSIEAVFDLYRARGELFYGERVSQNAHALQSATAAEADAASPELVLAALLHDIGHLFDPERAGGAEDDDRHEALGAERLRPLFGPAVAHPVALHVAAKRYLCATDPAYWAALSPASKRSLALQGGPFDPGQLERFTALPYWREAVALRRYDDAAKVVGAAVGDLEDYRPLMRRLAETT